MTVIYNNTGFARISVGTLVNKKNYAQDKNDMATV